ncbi:MAG: hypothetical protein WDN28_19940 [Chthoniobacter sp.]
MAAHTAQEISWDDMLNCDQAFAPDADKMTMDGPPPVASDKDGKYPVPEPGISKKARIRGQASVGDWPKRSIFPIGGNCRGGAMPPRQTFFERVWRLRPNSWVTVK